MRFGLGISSNDVLRKPLISVLALHLTGNAINKMMEKAQATVTIFIRMNTLNLRENHLHLCFQTGLDNQL